MPNPAPSPALRPALPDFPWDVLAPYAVIARGHPDGIVDLSVGTPVDAVPEPIRAALTAASDAPAYPLTAGTPRVREAIADWLRRRCAATGELGVLPTLGSKEFVAWLPTLLGLGPDDVVLHPELAYPTYDVGARLAGAAPMPSDSLTAAGPARVRLIWLNSPSNPTGRVLPPQHLAKVVAWGRERGALVVSDECYLELGWSNDATEQPVSVLDPRVCGENVDGVLAVHSLSKRSNLAGYRAGFVAGDRTVIDRLLAVRKHAGMMVPTPVQAAMVAALSDSSHVAEQRERYRARRSALFAALVSAGFRIDHSQAGLYLWATRGDDCWDSVNWFAERGILVAPGIFYGASGARHIRVAITATDERVAAAVARIGT